jgi:hypothetical protein
MHTTQNMRCHMCLLTSLQTSCQVAVVPSADSTLIDVHSDMRPGTDLPQFHIDLTDPDSCVPAVSAAVPVVPTLILTAHTIIVRITYPMFNYVAKLQYYNYMLVQTYICQTLLL